MGRMTGSMQEWNGVIDEIEKQFLSEFDYTKEATNLQGAAPAAFTTSTP